MAGLAARIIYLLHGAKNYNTSSMKALLEAQQVNKSDLHNSGASHG